jgi:predicted enzyme related to lactoylglutathione lyase
MSARNAINWFEIPSTDFDRACTFYDTVLGTPLHRMTMESGGTNEPLPMGILPSDEGKVGGAVVYIKEHKPATAGPLLYLNANPDLQIMLDRVVPAGGTLIMPKTKITDEIGYMAIFIDSEGNHMAFHSQA